MRRIVLALTAALLAVDARAGDVISTNPISVSVTVYRDRPAPAATARGPRFADQGLAFISETRTVDLPAGRSRIRFQGVAEGLIPQSAGVAGLPGRLVERNFDYDLLSAGSLVAHAVGQNVTVVRTAPRTGRETRERAVVRSGPQGVVLDFGGSRIEALRCDGAPERLVFDQAPPDLAARPTLSVVTDTPRAGRYGLRLSYLAVRLNWAADYVARVAADGQSLDLTGWITLVNGGATGFVDAPTAVVAGNVSRVQTDRPRPSAPILRPACWPGQTTHSGWVFRQPPAAAMQLARAYADQNVRGFSIIQPAAMAIPAPPPPPPPPVEESRLGDYHLYALTNRTTVAARQTKQVMFLRQEGVKFDTVYVSRGYTFSSGSAREWAQTTLRLDNTAERGLGRGLPAGAVQVRQRAGGGVGRELLVGQVSLDRDVPTGEPFELTLGGDADVVVRREASLEPPGSVRLGQARTQTVGVTATNAKAVPVVVEIRCVRPGRMAFSVARESQPHTLRSGDPVWRLTLPPGGEAALSYAVTLGG